MANEELEGWAGIDSKWMPDEMREAIEAQNEAIAQEQLDFARLVAKTFGSKHGRIVLAKFREMSTSGRMFDPEDNDFYLAAAKGFFRSGSVAFVDWVEHLIRVAEEGPPTAKGKK